LLDLRIWYYDEPAVEATDWRIRLKGVATTKEDEVDANRD